MSDNRLLFMYDYYYLWSAGHVALQGGNVYDLQQYQEALFSIGWPHYETVQTLTHPPINIPFYMIMALLPFKVSMLVWFIFSFALLLVLARQLQIIEKQSVESSSGIEPYFYIVWACISFPPVLKTLMWGQISLVLLFSLLMCFIQYDRKRYFISGVSLALSFLKPHHLSLLYLTLILESFRKRDFRFVGGMLCGGGLLLLLAVSMYPGGFMFYLEAGQSILQQGTNIRGASISQWVAYVLPFVKAQFLLITLANLVVFALVVLGRLEFKRDRNWLVALSLLVSPYIWSHDFTLLLPCFIYWPRLLYSRFPRFAHYALLPFATVGVLVSCFSGMEPYLFVIPLILFSMPQYRFRV